VTWVSRGVVTWRAPPCGDMGVTLSTCESVTRESVIRERSSSVPKHINSKPTTSEIGAAHARGGEEQQDDDRADLHLDSQAPDVISAEAVNWLCEVAGLPPRKVYQRARDVGVGFRIYGQAILRVRIRYNAGEIKHGLLGYIDATARNLVKRAPPPTSLKIRPLLGFEPLSAILQPLAIDRDGDPLSEPEIFMPAHRPIAASASLRNSGLVKR
jgi:hypothetical protein